MTKFVCFSGHAQNGKDTSAAIMSEELIGRGRSVIIVHYADLLKYICKNFFGWNGIKDIVGRSLLQHVGTERVRKQDPNFWVDFVVKVVSLFPDEWDYVLIPDVRFPNEINGICDAGFPVSHIRVVRENFISPLTEEQRKHVSETALDNIEPDYWLYNSSIQKLTGDVINLCDVLETEFSEIQEEV